jgi:5-methylcytosine-specific restriction endonuclease McrA
VAVARPCLGCGRLIASGSRCPACRVPRKRGRAWRRTRERVFARYGRVCHVCGAPATEIDHLISLAAGGGDLLANLRPACARCNRGWR